MDQALIGGSIGILISLLTFWLSYQVFRRQKSLENENHYFQFKIQKYESTLRAASVCSSALRIILFDSLDVLDKKKNEKALDKLAIEADEYLEKFRVELITHTSLVPDSIIERLDKLHNNYYVIVDDLDIEDIKSGEIKRLLDKLDRAEEQLERIVNLMRKDLGVASVDRRLKQRTHK